MPFTPIAVLDPERLKLTVQTLCRVFGIESLHPHQEEAGQNILKGISTILDVPTGGGKTITFWYPLFYHWQPGSIDENSQKIVLVVGPLVALMEDQAKSLNEKGVPAVAITATSWYRSRDSTILPNILQDLGKNKYRVGLVGPEMVLSPQFHEKVLNQVEFTKNIICLVIDELHCICEWGTDDFRPEYRNIVHLLARLPTGLPVLGASATAPYHVIKDILANLGLPDDCARVEVSNEKLNVFLSVQILQHEPDSCADLFILFPDEGAGPADFPQTLLYGNARQEVEKIQDFMRDNAPAWMDAKKAFEFYHRNIDEKQKESIQNRIKSGELRGVSATDALGLGMDFQTIMRIILWMRPRSFLSLVQKIGRCVRNPRLRGEAVLYITKAMYTRCCAELEILKSEKEAAVRQDAAAASDDEENPEEPADREEVLALQETSDEEEDAPTMPIKRRRTGKGKRKVLTPMEERDKRYFLEYITTSNCRRIAWNKYFGNQNKKRLNFPVPEGPCRDNCSPEAVQVPTIVLAGERKIKTGRKGISSPELENAVRDLEKLQALREHIVANEYPNQHFLTGDVIITDDVLDTLAKRARRVTSVETLLQQTYWIHASQYGDQFVAALQEVLVDFPDPDAVEREIQTAERTKRTLDAAAFKELRSRLVLVFEGCYDAVFSEMEYYEDAVAGPTADNTRKRKKPKAPRRRCQIFLKLPRSNVWPEYYEQIKEPISMSNIKTLSEKASHYTNIDDYRTDWHLMFSNARRFNIEGSQVYEDAVYLQGIFDAKLYALSAGYNLPGHERLPDTLPLASTAPTPPPVESLLPIQ
ncbi:P-loop containing nucleoside triphosphate hydrolase protein [Mycena sanguinolenta]|nr:P-loop containing nucleoside triphosphate hydrolase protein [Mycena sanguinolenta]KAJ6500781.1 P-loop containing nucleoside triphosphate hydrolase protein [Mycena sanguinolenta]